MSFSIGPFIGKRDNVIKAVTAAVATATKNCTNPQLSDVAAFIVAELEKAPAALTCTAHAWGHSDTNGRWATIGVNQMLAPSGMTPVLVE